MTRKNEKASMKVKIFFYPHLILNGLYSHSAKQASGAFHAQANFISQKPPFGGEALYQRQLRNAILIKNEKWVMANG
jgi:hypothetical protein